MFGILKVGAIDCLKEEELCEEFGVFDSPVIKIYREASSDDGIKFTGKNNWKAISGQASSLMQSFVRVVNSENYESFVNEAKDKNIVLLFTDRKTTAPLFKSLSKTYKDKLVFGEVKKDPELQQRFKIEKVPALIVVKDPWAYVSESYNMQDIKID